MPMPATRSPSTPRATSECACRSSRAPSHRPGSEPAPLTGGSLLVRRIGRLTTWHGPVRSDAALLARDGRVVWTGADRDVPGDAGDVPELDAAGAAVLPGFVDAHTHLVWAGSRRDDFAARI